MTRVMRQLNAGWQVLVFAAQNVNLKNRLSLHHMAVLSIVCIKLIALGLLSSAYQDELFTPFVNWFLTQGGQPWEAIYQGHLSAEFPYTPFMLYQLSIFYWPASFFHIDNIFVLNLIHGFPLLVADLVIAHAMMSLTKSNNKSILYAYLLSPIIFFSTMVHHQLDVIPMAWFMLSLVYLMRHQIHTSAILFAIAISSKLNIVAILPIILFYCCRRQNYRSALNYVLITIGLFALAVEPYVFDKSFQQLVLFNHKQSLLFHSYFMINGIHFYLPFFVTIALYIYLLTFKKFNFDMLIAYACMIFVAIIFFIKQSPGWYVWIVPLITILIYKSKQQMEGRLLLAFLGVSYLGYFLFAHHFEYDPIRFLGDTVSLVTVHSAYIKGLLYTTLEASLFCTMLYVFNNAIRSHALYRRKQAFAIGISGDSGSGKTHLRASLNQLLNDRMLYIEGDSTHKWERGNQQWEVFTHLNPKANYLYRQTETILKLKQWQKVKIAHYQHHNGQFSEPVTLKPKEFLLISGLHPFYLPISRKALDFKIYMSPNESLRQHWKIKRDTHERHHPLADVLKQLKARVEDAKKYIYPQKAFADVIIHFFPLEDIDDLVNGPNPRLGLAISLDADTPVERLIALLDVEVDWQYSEDLKKQTLRLLDEPEGLDYHQLASHIIPTLDEIVMSPHFASGYDGLIQLLLLMCICQKMGGYLALE